MTALPTGMSDWADAQASLVVTSLNGQYQQIGLAEHLWRKAMGGTVTLSSNGTTASAADNITLSTHIRVTAGAAFSWAVYAYGVGTASQRYVLISWFDVGASSRQVHGYSSYMPYTGGSTTALPTTTAGYEIDHSTWYAVPWAVVEAGYVNYAYSATSGVGYFWVKPVGSPPIVFTKEYFAWQDECQADDPFRDNGPRKIVGWSSDLGTVFRTATGCYVPDATGLTNTTVCTPSAEVWQRSGNGPYANSKYHFDDIHYLVNSSSSQEARDVGFSRIFKAVSRSGGTPFNGRLSTDTDTWTWWTTGGDIAILWKRSLLNIS